MPIITSITILTQPPTLFIDAFLTLLPNQTRIVVMTTYPPTHSYIRWYYRPNHQTMVWVGQYYDGIDKIVTYRY